MYSVDYRADGGSEVVETEDGCRISVRCNDVVRDILLVGVKDKRIAQIIANQIVGFGFDSHMGAVKGMQHMFRTLIGASGKEHKHDNWGNSDV